MYIIESNEARVWKVQVDPMNMDCVGPSACGEWVPVRMWVPVNMENVGPNGYGETGSQ